jgi:hypothetical protein
MNNNYEEVILRISSEEKGGWARNYFLDFTTNRIIVSKKSLLTKFADLGYVAGLAPYPYLVLLKDSNPSTVHSKAISSPEELLKLQGFSIWDRGDPSIFLLAILIMSMLEINPVIVRGHLPMSAKSLKPSSNPVIRRIREKSLLK